LSLIFIIISRSTLRRLLAIDARCATVVSLGVEL
jgi:hypothetical protein